MAAYPSHDDIRVAVAELVRESSHDPFLGDDHEETALWYALGLVLDDHPEVQDERLGDSTL